MTSTTKTNILDAAARVYASGGYGGFSIRTLAKEISITPSVIYHYYANEAELLRSMFDTLNNELGKKRALLPQVASARAMLKQRIGFQIDNAEDIVAVLKYYLDYRGTFSKNKNGFLPDKSTLHIEEVLRFGKRTGEFHVANVTEEAQVITHAINGFLLEYYPYKMDTKEKEKLIRKIYGFLMKALKGGEYKHG